MTGNFTASRALVGFLAIQTYLTVGGGPVSAQEIGSYAQVQTGALNLRTAPNTWASVLRALPYGMSKIKNEV